MKKYSFTNIKFIFSGMAILVLLLCGIDVQAQEVLLRPSGDAVAWSELPAQTATAPGVLGGGNILANRYEVTVDETTVTHNVYAYIKFDVSQFRNRTIKSAAFSTRGTAKADTETTIQLRKAGIAFSRDTTNWVNKPGASGELALKIYNTASARRPYDLAGAALVTYINEELAKGATEIGFSLQYKAGTLNGVNWIGGKGDNAWGPELVLEFDEPRVFLSIADAAAFKEDPTKTGATHHASNLSVTKIDDNTEHVSFVKFNLQGFAYKRISAVEFSTRGTSKAGKEQTVQLRRTGTAFARDTTNWSNKPSMSGKLATRVYNSVSARTVYTQINAEMVNYINEELAKGNETIAFGLQYDSGDLDGGNWIGGKGDALWGPMLSVVPDNENYAAYSIADAVAFSNLPTQTGAQFHASNILVAQETDVRTVISYVKFDISGFSGRVVGDAKFSTRSATAAGKEVTIKLTQAGDGFQRDTTNWGNKPTTSGELATVVYNDNSQRKVFTPNGNELVNYINSKLRSGATVISFGLAYKEGDGTAVSWIGGKGDAAWGPRLELSFDYGFNSFASADAVVLEHQPDATASVIHATNLRVEKTETTQIISFVKFNIADIGDMEITGASFSTRGPIAADKTLTIKLTQAGTDFTRAETTWNTKPSHSGELATVVLDNNSGRKNWDQVGTALVDYINQQTLNGREEVAFGLAYKEGDGGSLNWMGGKGDGAWGPQLELIIRRPLEADTIFVVEDAYISEAAAGDNFGAAADMGIRKSGNATDLETLVKFDISELSDAVIGKVSLTAYIGQHDSGTAQTDFFVDVFAVEDNSWLEMGVNWTNKPVAGAKLVEENVKWFGAGQDVVWSSAALTHYINTAVAQGRTHVSFILKGKANTPGNRLWMAGREWKPKATSLILDYVTPPPPQQLPSVADSYVSQVAAEVDANFGTQADQHLINDDANNASKWIYFRYDISGAYGTGVSATMNAYGSIHNSAPNLAEFNFGVYPVTNVTWKEDSITWTNKPAVTNQQLLTGTFTSTTGSWQALTSVAFTDYVNQAIKDGKSYISLAVKGLNPTPGERAYLSGKEWRASNITINYEPEAALPRFAPNPGQFISSVNVAITTPTANASIYYTLDNTAPSNTNGTLYTSPIALTAASAIETFNVKAIAYAPELNPSGVASATYTVTPVSLPEFNPSPLVKYQESVEVTITVNPAGSVIRYSLDGGAPTTLYDEAILLTETTKIRAQAYNADFSFSTAIVEATFEIVETQPNPGVGPGGVGFADLSRANQPALSLWLRAHDLDLADGAKVTSWSDNSGNENHAHNDEAAVGTQIPNAGEPWKAAPTFVANGLNGLPTLNFGTQFGGDNANVKNLVVDDADNLDGGAGISIFMVVKRNQMFGDFAAIFQKRDVRDQNNNASYILEMDGGANPNKMQFVIARDIFLKSLVEYNADDFYLVNVGLNSKHKLATFFSNGELKNSALYQKPVKNSHAPVIIGGFQPVDIAEVIMFNSDVNMAQTIIIQNYLAAKYGLTGIGNVFYSNADYVNDIIGVGRATDVTGNDFEIHNLSYGAGLQLSASGFGADGDFILAGHNGAELNDNNVNKAWTRQWYIKTAGNGGNVTLGFDFDADGITSDPSTDMKLYHRDSETAEWAAMDITPTIEEKMLSYALTNAQTGYYALGSLEVSTEELLVSGEKGGFLLYPNPASERITVQIENVFSGKVEVRILDIYGRLVRSEMVVKDAAVMQHELDVANLRNGTYMVELISQSKRSIKLFMVQ